MVPGGANDRVRCSARRKIMFAGSRTWRSRHAAAAVSGGAHEDVGGEGVGELDEGLIAASNADQFLKDYYSAAI
jgi:hypothetical protein